MSADFEDAWIPTPAGRLFARRWHAPAAAHPAAAPLLLFHDSLGCVDLWRDAPARLAAASGRAVVAYDRLGFGRSDPHPGALDLDFIGAESTVSVPAIRTALGLTDFVALGHSVGGGMAAHAAARFPRDCRALVTESAQCRVEPLTLAGIRQAKVAFESPEMLARLERSHGDKARWVLAAWTETWLSDAFAGWTLDDVLPRVACPTLVIHGAQDEYGTPAQPERIAALVGGPSRLEILPGLHHVPHREAPDVVVALVRDFLAEVR